MFGWLRAPLRPGAPTGRVDEGELSAALKHLQDGAAALDRASQGDAELTQFAGEVRDIVFRLGGRRALGVGHRDQLPGTRR
jgi:hypothetical protein